MGYQSENLFKVWYFFLGNFCKVYNFFRNFRQFYKISCNVFEIFSFFGKFLKDLAVVRYFQFWQFYKTYYTIYNFAKTFLCTTTSETFDNFAMFLIFNNKQSQFNHITSLFISCGVNLAIADSNLIVLGLGSYKTLGFYPFRMCGLQTWKSHFSGQVSGTTS